MLLSTNMNNLLIKKITSSEDIQIALDIRYKVFVEEQDVPFEDEREGFDPESHHYLVYIKKQPVGAARWRYTDNGIKLERFAVLEEFRGHGLGKALVQYIVNDLPAGKRIYLHAQIQVVEFYIKLGFQKIGDLFDESGIDHYEMEIKKGRVTGDE